MNNLPITTSPTPAAAVSKQTTGANDNADNQNSQPFGEVLARQINTPASKDADKNTGKDAKAAASPVADLLTQVAASAGAQTDSSGGVTDINDLAALKGGKGAKDVGDQDTAQLAAGTTPPQTTASTDMLAAILPQVVPTTAPNTSSTAADAGSKPDTKAIAADMTAPDKRGITSLKSDSALMQQAASAAPKAADHTPFNDQGKEQSFAAALIGASRMTPANTALGTTREPLAATQSTNAAAFASLQHAAATMTAVAQAPVQATVNTPVNQPNWSDDFSQKVTWLASSKQDQTAELHLNPPQLGPVDVVLKVSGDQATALFTSPHAAVRDAIEQAIPRLRDMLADNGIMLGNATVSDQAQRDQGQTASQRSAPASGTDLRSTAAAADSPIRVSPIARHNGIVDTFA